MPELPNLVDAASYITQYGILGFGLFCLISLWPFSAMVLKNKVLGYTFAGLGVICLIVFTSFEFFARNFPNLLPQPTLMVSGAVRQLDGRLAANIRADLDDEGVAFARREYDRHDRSRVNIPFFFATTPANLPTCIGVELRPLGDAVAVEELRTFADEPALFRVNLDPEQVKAGMAHIIQVDLKSGVVEAQIRVRRKDGPSGTPATINQLGQNERACTAVGGRAEGAPDSSSFAALLVRTAWAQGGAGAGSDTNIREQLQAADPVIRRNARIDLSLQGTAAFDLIASLLAESNYRLQLGAAAAVAAMPEDVRRQAPPQLRQRLTPLLRSTDRTLRETAYQALAQPAFCYQELDPRRGPEDRYLVICYFDDAQCNAVRGPNAVPGVRQSACQPIDLQRASWRPGLGYLGGWYQFSPSPIPEPFPQLAQ